jgi:thiopurine S-methyltransferase
MQKTFWLERWQLNQIGFHNKDINPHLKQNWSSLELMANSQVFVPFCGKSQDLLWLRQQGYQVIAVELSLLAVESFFAENKLPFHKTQVGEFDLFETDGIQIYCGDFFQFPTDVLSSIHAVYDRASLVALPVEMRFQYAEKMRELLPLHTQILLVSFFYHQHEMDGPPFSVDQQDVIKLYGDWCNVRKLYNDDIIGKEPHFKARGLSVIHEEIYSITVINLKNVNVQKT